MRYTISFLMVVVVLILTLAGTSAVADLKKTPNVNSNTASSIAATPEKFRPACKLPFDDIKTEDLEIDKICSIDGNAGDDVGKRLESNAKNNFCATGKAIPITYSTLKQLQAASDDIMGLKSKLKDSRDVLTDILKTTGGKVGEGQLVRFVAFILDAHFSNTGKRKPPKKEGELVNCNNRAEDFNDIHIELVMSKAEEEMSPHFRPEAWDKLPGLELGRPVRITGPLFFDSSHQPCRNGKRPNPKRISVWEIHPVYQLEVCKNKSMTTCKVGVNSQWIPLDQWLESEEEEEPGR
jgi:hypothetical protein